MMNRCLLALWVLLVCVAGPVLAQSVCEFCKGSLQVQTLEYRDGGHAVCLKCRQNLPTCSLCHNPSPGPRYRDGRYICPSCRKTGVFDRGRVAQLAIQVQAFLTQTLGKEFTSSLPPIQLVDEDELQTKFNESGRAMSVVAFYRPYNPEMVYLLSGETELESCSHLSHELTHAWQSRACSAQDRALSEGFACWVQYQYLLSRGQTQAAEALTRHSDPDYGASLRTLLPRSRTLGKDKFIQAVRKARKLSDV